MKKAVELSADGVDRVIVLGIETSCDETAVAIVENGTTLLANVVASSMDMHVAYGGVVPEVAARSHIEVMIPVVEKALQTAFGSEERRAESEEGAAESEERRAESGDAVASKIQDLRSKIHPTATQASSPNPWSKIDAIAVTHGAGLGGSLLVGVMTARTLAIVHEKPLYAVNHVEAHVYANFLTEIGNKGATESGGAVASKIQDLRSKIHPAAAQKSELTAQDATLGGKKYTFPSSQPQFPMLALIVSGGHSQLALFQDHSDYELLGITRDDAIGEAFDKVAKIIGLPYPGGPSIDKAAKKGDPFKYILPKAQLQGRGASPRALKAQKRAQKDAPGSPSRSQSTVSVEQQGKVLGGQSYDFSFSGLKTAVLRLAQKEIGEDFTFPSFKVAERLSEAQKNDIAASFQRVAIETLVDKTVLAYEKYQPKSVVIAGGVAASGELRVQLEERLQKSRDAAASKIQDPRSKIHAAAAQNSEPRTQNSPTPIIEYPDMKLCTDNGAMVATLGCYKAMSTEDSADPYSLTISPNLTM